jgi:DnaJ-class molecular chaperone
MKRIRTHYDTLKVSRDAPIEVIQAAYRSLARKHHPDRAGGSRESEAIMKAINAAYEVLSDPEARARHDQWIADRLAGQPESDAAGRSSRPGGIPVGSVLVAVCYAVTAFSLLRFPGLFRLIGIGMLLAGAVYALRRAR